MRTYSLRLAIVVAAALAPSFAGAQREGHQTGSPQTSSAELSQCLRVQPVIQNIITAATARVEAARLSNSPAEMRAAVDHLEAALRDIRTQLAPCSAAGATTDPHAGHTTPSTQQPTAGAAPAMPTGVADPHAGHTIPSPSAPSKSPPTAKPTPSKPSSGPTADPHAGHAMPKGSSGTSAAPNERAAASGNPQSGDAEHIKSWLTGYDAAFVARDLDKLATFYHPDVTIFEGGSVNRGWADYRDNHLGPELKDFQNPQFSHTNVVVRMLGPDGAYVTADYIIKGRMGEREVDGGGLATLVLIREAGAWKIRHSHTSSRRRAPAAGGAGPAS